MPPKQYGNTRHPELATADPLTCKVGSWLVRWHPETEQWHAQHESRMQKPVAGAHEILCAMLDLAQTRRQERINRG